MVSSWSHHGPFLRGIDVMSAEMDKNSALVAILSIKVKSYFSRRVLIEPCHKKNVCKYYIASMCSVRLVYAK